MSFTEKNGLKINSKLFNFINNEVIPGTNINSDEFWSNFEKAVHELAPLNKKLIDMIIARKRITFRCNLPIIIIYNILISSLFCLFFVF